MPKDVIIIVVVICACSSAVGLAAHFLGWETTPLFRQYNIRLYATAVVVGCGSVLVAAIANDTLQRTRWLLVVAIFLAATYDFWAPHFGYRAMN